MRQVMSSSALTVICLTVLQKRACYPKESVFSSLVISLFPLYTAAVPYLIIQNDDPGSPSFTITCPLAYYWVMSAPAIVSLWSFERLLKNRTFSMNFLFSQYSKMMISSTARRKVFLSIAQRWQCSHALTEKALGDLQRRAISPKPSPTLSVFLILSLEMTCIIPFSMMKKHIALLSSLKTKVSLLTEQQNIFLATFSISASLRLQKIK